ncbi:unnamed protein product [Chrysoparadoxa australica]
MQIFVKTLSATLSLDVSPSTTLGAVKAAVEDSEFIPCDMQRLLCGGVQHQANDLTLEESGINDADTLTLLLRVNGGMRAKWRKKRMRRLRRKRRKMRQRAR